MQSDRSTLGLNKIYYHRKEEYGGMGARQFKETEASELLHMDCLIIEATR